MRLQSCFGCLCASWAHKNVQLFIVLAHCSALAPIWLPLPVFFRGGDGCRSAAAVLWAWPTLVALYRALGQRATWRPGVAILEVSFDAVDRNITVIQSVPGIFKGTTLLQHLLAGYVVDLPVVRDFLDAQRVIDGDALPGSALTGQSQ